MQPTREEMVFIVDDDDSVREALSWLLRSRGIVNECHTSGESFVPILEALAQQHYDQPERGYAAYCVLLDVRMAGISGLQVFERILQLRAVGLIPPIFLTGHADVRTAVDAVKRGAFDFCEKPFSDNALVDRVHQALALSGQYIAQHRATNQMRSKYDALTERERTILHLVQLALPNKIIADKLGISVRTVEVHRARVFDKMGVRSAIELAKLVHDLGLSAPDGTADVNN